jgi:mRNA interferase RelE/StbE
MKGEYKIFETSQFLEKLEHQDFKGRKEKILLKLGEYVYPQLKEEPHFGLNIKKLWGKYSEVWRYRVGDWRFFYSIDEKGKIIFMLSIKGRGEAY